MPEFDRRSIPEEAMEGQWTAPDGWPIRRIDWPVPTDGGHGSILFLPGRGDFYEKYLETLDHYARAGFAVTAADWRGQGLSGRLAEGQVGHIPDFALWVDDLAALFTAWSAERQGPHIVMAHSMGGHIVMRALVEHRITPVAAILCAPMLGIKGGGLPDPLAQQLAAFMCRVRGETRPAWKVSERPDSPLSLRQKLLTHDDARYGDEMHWLKERPGLHLGPGSWRWVERAYDSVRRLRAPGAMEGVRVPVHICATHADQLVSTARIIELAARLPDAELKLYGREAAHEMLREVDAVRDRVIGDMDAFLRRVLKRDDPPAP